MTTNDQLNIRQGLSGSSNPNPYSEFTEFSRNQIKEYNTIFKKYDVDNNEYIDQMELKLMMENLGVPQTHTSLKAMIREVDEDLDGMISFREFLLIYRKAAAGELKEGSGLHDLAKLTDLNESGDVSQ
ncbi:EF-hand domain-containing protein D2-like [Antedon mediterranea]|uniref:EF-hand domain-containing protein D2-like n=1 Tax=Antedon mediterranea TaxID=105859 RepID=UPI003AF76AB3